MLPVCHKLPISSSSGLFGFDYSFPLCFPETPPRAARADPRRPDPELHLASLDWAAAAHRKADRNRRAVTFEPLTGNGLDDGVCVRRHSEDVQGRSLELGNLPDKSLRQEMEINEVKLWRFI